MTITANICKILSNHVYNDPKKFVNLPSDYKCVVPIEEINSVFSAEPSNWANENGTEVDIFYTSNSGCQAAFYYNKTTNEGVRRSGTA